MSETAYTDVKKFVATHLGIRSSLSSGGRLSRSLQHFIEVRHCAPHRSLYDAIISVAMSAEKRCPRAGLAYLRLIAKDRPTFDSPLRTRSDLSAYLETDGFSRRALDLLEQILILSDKDTRIVVKRDKRDDLLVVKRQGCNLKCRHLTQVIGWREDDVRIGCIDGYIENVSEIHHLLTDMSNKDASVVLFVRGASDDVLNTITVNNKRGVFRLNVVAVPYDLDGVNTIVDAAVTAGIDVTSTLKGDLVSSLTFDSLGSVERCILTPEGVCVVPSRSSMSNVHAHIDRLRKKRDEAVPGTEDLTTDRMHAMTSSTITVVIPDGIIVNHFNSEVDEIIRIVNAIVSRSFEPEAVARKTYDDHMHMTQDVVYV